MSETLGSVRLAFDAQADRNAELVALIGGCLTRQQAIDLFDEMVPTGSGGGTTPATYPVVPIALDGYTANATSILNQFGTAPDGGDHYRWADNGSNDRHFAGRALGTLDAGTYRIKACGMPEGRTAARVGVEWSGATVGAYYDLNLSATTVPVYAPLGAAPTVSGLSYAGNGIGAQKALQFDVVIPAGAGNVDFNVFGANPAGTIVYAGGGADMYWSKMSYQRIA